MEVKERRKQMPEVPLEFRVESFEWIREKLGVRKEAVERLSLPRIAEAAKKCPSNLLETVEEYYASMGWLLAAAEVAKKISTIEALERAEQYYVKGEFYRSAAEVAEKIGTTEALKRAIQYRTATC